MPHKPFSFYCQAMHHLGVPTTRAGTCVTSDTWIQRDVFYTGNVIDERATVVLRIAPTFIRFGSFEIFKPADLITGREGPSVGRKDVLLTLLDYVISSFFPDVSGVKVSLPACLLACLPNHLLGQCSIALL
jgi:uncharacterized protein YdiU (UPF0061 family)